MKKLILPLLIASLTAPSALAQLGTYDPSSSYTTRHAQDAVRNGENMSLSDIFDRLRRQYGGQKVFAKLEDPNTYYIEWITRDGHKLKLRVDARTGNQK